MNNDTSHEKPYDFVPISDEEKNKEAAGHHTMIGSHSKRLLSGVLQGKVVSESLIQVASGFVVPVEDILQFDDIDRGSIGVDQLVAAHMRTKGCRIIPGSTLKGAIRSAIEAITAPGVSFEPQMRSKEIRRRGHSISVREIRMHTYQQRLSSPPKLPSISLANRLFGLTSGKQGYQGHCSFYDALQQSGNGVLFRRLPLYRPQPDYSEGDPRLETGWGRYFLNVNRTRVRGRKFYRSGISREVDEPYTVVEACSPGSEFNLQIHFQNLSEAEIGIMLIVMGADSDIVRLKIGGGKPVSMGTIHFSELSLLTINEESYTSIETRFDSHSIVKCVNAANASSEIIPQGREKLAEIMKHPVAFVAGGKERIY